MAGTGTAARQGILVKMLSRWSKRQKLIMSVFDKTGTLTEGKPVLTQLNALNNETELAALAYALSQYSEHPLAKAIVSYVINHNVDLLAVSDLL